MLAMDASVYAVGSEPAAAQEDGCRGRAAVVQVLAREQVLAWYQVQVQA